MKNAVIAVIVAFLIAVNVAAIVEVIVEVNIVVIGIIRISDLFVNVGSGKLNISYDLFIVIRSFLRTILSVSLSEINAT